MSPIGVKTSTPNTSDRGTKTKTTNLNQTGVLDQGKWIPEQIVGIDEDFHIQVLTHLQGYDIMVKELKESHEKVMRMTLRNRCVLTMSWTRHKSDPHHFQFNRLQE
jgi:hypothetical protein